MQNRIRTFCYRSRTLFCLLEFLYLKIRTFCYLLFLISIGLVIGCSRPAVDIAESIAGYPDFEIVESAPIETTLNNPRIRDTQIVWREMINQAKKTLDIEAFYIANLSGEPLEEVIEAIIDAGERGVKVRIISALEFYQIYPKTIDRLKKKKNIKLRLINMGEMTGGIMHAKYFIVDGREVFLGSQNFDWCALKHIREIGVRIENEEFAKILCDLFNLDWKLTGLSNPKSFKKFVVRKDYHIPIKMSEPQGEVIEFYPVYSPTGLIPDEKLWEERHLINLISHAKKDILIHLLSYSPVTQRASEFYPALDNALRIAASKGVAIKLIISDWAKFHPWIDHLKSLTLVPNIEVKLSTIPQWSKGFIPYARVDHCKYLVVDNNKCWIGNANWERDFFYKSRNVGVVIKNERINKILSEVFFTTWKGLYTYSLRPEIDYPPPKICEEEKTGL